MMNDPLPCLSGRMQHTIRVTTDPNKQQNSENEYSGRLGRHNVRRAAETVAFISAGVTVGTYVLKSVFNTLINHTSGLIAGPVGVAVAVVTAHLTGVVAARVAGVFNDCSLYKAS